MNKMSGKVITFVMCLAMCSIAAANPEIDYKLNCQGCHLPDGTGFVNKVPSFALLGDFLSVPGGREFLVQVPGTSQSLLSDSQAAEVLNWIVENFSDYVPKDFRHYTAAEVGDLRSIRVLDVLAIRAQLMDKIEHLKDCESKC